VAYDGVVLDMDGVLVGHTPWELKREAVVGAFEAVGVSPDGDDLEAVVRRSSAAAELADRYGFEPAAFFDAYDERLCEAQLEAIADGGKPAYPDTDALRTLGLALGVASNNYTPVVEAVLARDDLASLVHSAHGITPGAAGRALRKPDPTLLRRAVAGIGADRPLFVGDSPADLGAGRAAGVDVALLSRPEESRREVDAEPAHRIESLRSLDGLLG
jgi:HAD superfamily hydrolase (TIGR01549 family)